MRLSKARRAFRDDDLRERFRTTGVDKLLQPV
jgi:hypothetical protein